jgi:hypothetical protein
MTNKEDNLEILIFLLSLDPIPSFLSFCRLFLVVSEEMNKNNIIMVL